MNKKDFCNNSFNTLRLLAALSVLCLHAKNHLNIQGGILLSIVQLLNTFFMGVPIFYCLSGYLVWNSVKTSASNKEYFRKRFLRIYPELWIAVILEIITILIFYKQKIKAMMLPVFAATQATVFQFWTPDFLRGYGCGVPNGSLGTICILIQFYIVIWVIRKWLINKKPVFWVVLFAISMLISFCTGTLAERILPDIIYKLLGVTPLQNLWLFVLGVRLCEFSNELIPILKKYWIVFLMAYLLILYPLAGIDFDFGSYSVLRCMFMIFTFFGMAYAFPCINVKKDISYGIYLYHMIVINVMIQQGWTEKPYYILVVATVTVVLAFGSSFLSRRIIRCITKK